MPSVRVRSIRTATAALRSMMSWTVDGVAGGQRHAPEDACAVEDGHVARDAVPEALVDGDGAVVGREAAGHHLGAGGLPGQASGAVRAARATARRRPRRPAPAAAARGGWCSPRSAARSPARTPRSAAYPFQTDCRAPATTQLPSWNSVTTATAVVRSSDGPAGVPTCAEMSRTWPSTAATSRERARLPASALSHASVDGDLAQQVEVRQHLARAEHDRRQRILGHRRAAARSPRGGACRGCAAARRRPTARCRGRRCRPTAPAACARGPPARRRRSR